MCSARAAWAVAAALVLAGCGEGEGPIGSPGGRNGIQLTYLTPQVQAVATGAPARVVLALEVRRLGPDDSLAPWAGAVLHVERAEGKGLLLASTAVTGADGRASVEIQTTGSADRTHVDFILDGDRHSHLPFDVVTAPVVAVDPLPGAVVPLDPPRSGAILRFAFEPGDRYVLIPTQVDPDRSAIPYRFLRAGTMTAGTPSALGTRPAVVVEDRGDVVAGAIEPGGLVPAATIPGAVNIRSCRIEVDRVAPLRYLGSHVAMYVDGPADQGQARIDSLGREFDEHIFPTNSSLFGPTTDRDGNGVVYLVMSPLLESLGGVYCDSVRMQGIEAFYAVWNPVDPIDRTLAILAHEHQHVVNAGHHLVSRGTIGDERWLNEAMSLAAEALNGYWATPFIRVWQFLSGQNGGLTMLPFVYSPPFDDEYMMFMLYLGDRFGPELYLRLGTSGYAGRRNVEEVTGVSFEALVRDWLVAAGMSGRAAGIDPVYGYRTLDLHGMEAEIEGCACVPKTRFEGMYLERLRVDLPFDIYRTLSGYDADYFQLEAPPELRSAEVFFDAFGMQATGLTVARLRSAEEEAAE